MSSSPGWPARARRALVLGALLGGCDLGYPEVVVVNGLGESVLIGQPSFSGCRWPTVLGDGDATAPRSCLPGSDRIHFEKLAAAAYCQQQAADGTLPGVCPCAGTGGADGAGGEAASSPSEPGLVDEQPRWFNYQTKSTYEVGYGDFLLVEITAGDVEQDFSVPGPYGH